MHPYDAGDPRTNGQDFGVKATFTRPKRVRETPEVAAGVRRMVSALGRRIGQGDPVDLHELVRLREAVDEALRVAVAGQRELFSWAEIAAGLGTTREAAWQRFGKQGRTTSLGGPVMPTVGTVRQD